MPLKQDAAVIGLVGLAHAASHFGHMLLPPLFPVFMKEFGLSFSELGLLVTIFFVISGVGQAGAGFLWTGWARGRCCLAPWPCSCWPAWRRPGPVATRG